MHHSREWARDFSHVRAETGASKTIGQTILSLLISSALAVSVAAQDVGSQANEFRGNGAVITVKLHDATGGSFSPSAVVKLFRGLFPSGQKDASRGVAEFVVTTLGEFTVVVSAPGYVEAQKDVSVGVAGRTQVDVYLRPTPPAGSLAIVPGRPVLAPNAKEALDQGLRALKKNKIGEAEKFVGEAARLAPANPDVLYVQGLLSLKKRDWEQARIILEKATQVDPNSARTFAALGMALCNEGNCAAAIAPLEKSLQLEPSGTWQARWALAKSYYQGQKYDDALNMSQRALKESNGEEPQIALLVAQSQTAVGRYEDAAQTLRAFLRDHRDRPEAATAQRWLDQLASNGKIH